jgi:transposase InsO family protein
MERSHAALRQVDVHLRRKSLTFAKSLRWLNAKFALVVAWYNLVRPHMTLSRNPDRSTTPRTPAMAAGIQDHPWTASEFLALAWVP